MMYKRGCGVPPQFFAFGRDRYEKSEAADGIIPSAVFLIERPNIGMIGFTFHESKCQCTQPC